MYSWDLIRAAVRKHGPGVPQPRELVCFSHPRRGTARTGRCGDRQRIYGTRSFAIGAKRLGQPIIRSGSKRRPIMLWHGSAPLQHLSVYSV